MTGRVLSGEDAKRVGLVTHVSEDPLAHAKALMAEMEVRSPDAVGAGKLLLQEAWRNLDEAALRAERLWQRRVMGSRNQRISVERNQRKTDIPFQDRTI